MDEAEPSGAVTSAVDPVVPVGFSVAVDGVGSAVVLSGVEPADVVAVVLVELVGVRVASMTGSVVADRGAADDVGVVAAAVVGEALDGGAMVSDAATGEGGADVAVADGSSAVTKPGWSSSTIARIRLL